MIEKTAEGREMKPDSRARAVLLHQFKKPGSEVIGGCFRPGKSGAEGAELSKRLPVGPKRLGRVILSIPEMS
jgi:hypothetical protein